MSEQKFGGFSYVSHDVDVCVVGGGMAGLCAAIASARQGAKTVLVQDRPVLGGNASSEVRMWICGAHGKNVKETGVLEELQLENQYLNPGGNWSIWDAALWSKASNQPNLTLLLNCACCDGESEAVAGDPTLRRLTSIRCWQLTTQTWHTIGAKVFIDSSGDSVLAPISGAETRWGREARGEFDEDIEPSTADRKTMGNTLLIQLRKVDKEVPFTPPPFAYVFEKPSDLPNRINGVRADNFWWMELGGLQDTIKDGELIRDELMRVAWGVWDYIKNRAPAKADAANWSLEFLGSLPGKRENRRYVGPHTMSQNDVRAAGDPNHYSDAIAYGGWSMDDHHPAGLLYPGAPTIFHPAPSPFVIPYRTLYSRNVVNLMCAGRNISVTHAALSATRVMATCSLLGQAAGTAAAMAVGKGIAPSQIFPHHVPALQQQLMQDDCWIPGRTRHLGELSATAMSDASPIRAGHDRPTAGGDNAWTGAPGTGPTLLWKSPTFIGAVRTIFDSNLSHEKRMPHSYPQNEQRSAVPKSLVKTFRIETRNATGEWEVAYRGDNHQRLSIVPVNRSTDAVRLIAEETWGDGEARLFAFDALPAMPQHLPVPQPRVTWSSMVAKQKPEDLLPPECKVDAKYVHSHGGVA